MNFIYVLDSVLGVSKGFFDGVEVRIVILGRGNHLQQAGLHLTGKTTRKEQDDNTVKIQKVT